MNPNPFFSIVIPTYNRAEFIHQTITSALNQNFDSFEVIVVDDGSTDNTEEVVKSIKDDRLTYYKKENSERAASRNFGAQKALGKYINFFDSDDILYPHHLSEAYKTIEINNNPDALHLGYEIISSNGKVLKKLNNITGDVDQILVEKGNLLSCNGVFLLKKVALKFPFNEDRALSGSEDHELWLRISVRYKIYLSNAITSAIINHNERSVLVIDKNKLIKRLQLFVHYIFQDDIFTAKYGRLKHQIEAQSYTYIALHLALSEDKKQSIKYLFLALKKKPSVFFSKRFLATVKRIFIKYK